MLGMEPDMSDEVDGGHDFILPDGRTIDVKGATFYTSPDLKLPVGTAPEKLADIYVLVSFNQDRLLGEVVGWATKGELLAGEVKTYGTDSRYSKNYTLTRKDLHPIAGLFTSLKGDS